MILYCVFALTSREWLNFLLYCFAFSLCEVIVPSGSAGLFMTIFHFLLFCPAQKEFFVLQGFRVKRMLKEKLSQQNRCNDQSLFLNTLQLRVSHLNLGSPSKLNMPSLMKVWWNKGKKDVHAFIFFEKQCPVYFFSHL